MDYQSFVDQFEDLVRQESLRLKSPLNSLESEMYLGSFNEIDFNFRESKNAFIRSLYDENQHLEADIAVFQERKQKLYDLIDENMNVLNKPSSTSNALVSL